MTSGYRRYGCILGSLLFLAVGSVAHAQGNGTIESADPTIHGDGTMSPPAAAAMTRGPLPRNDAEAAVKQAATRAAQDEAAFRPAAPASGLSAEAREAALGRIPAIVGGHSFAGLSATNSTPSSASGAAISSKICKAATARSSMTSVSPTALRSMKATSY